jgi:hypothetical protein
MDRSRPAMLPWSSRPLLQEFPLNAYQRPDRVSYNPNEEVILNCKIWTITVLLVALPTALTQNTKAYKHASEYEVADLDQNLHIDTGTDVTLGKTETDAKLGRGGEGFHRLHTERGDFRVEAPINKGRTIALAMVSTVRTPVIHNQWFLDNVQPGTKVLFASHCAKPSKKHPAETVRCTFWFPDPDSTTHEYETIGDFTPYITGDGSNTQAAASALCGTGKLKAETEAQICSGAPAQGARP